jgi:hypothetical protein
MVRNRDSSVGIATRYGLDIPEIESRWGARFSAPVQTGSEAHPASCTMGTGSFPGVKWPGRDVDHPPSFSAELKERLELYLYSPSGPSWSVLGWSLPLILYDNRWWESVWLREGNRFVEYEVTRVGGGGVQMFCSAFSFMDMSNEQLQIGIDVWYRCALLTVLYIWCETF